MGYECGNPPCLHVVLDEERRVYAVFLETSEGELIYVPAERLREACRRLEKAEAVGFREARGGEVDEVASSVLGAVPLEEG